VMIIMGDGCASETHRWADTRGASETEKNDAPPAAVAEGSLLRFKLISFSFFDENNIRPSDLRQVSWEV